MPLFQNLFGPVFPPDVFVFSDEAVSWFHFESSGKERWRLSAAREAPLPDDAWPRQALGRAASEPRAVAETVEAARRLAGGRLRKAAVVVPDAWVRAFLLDFEEIPGSARETDEMVSWKLRKLLPFRPEEFRFVWAPIDGGKKVFAVGMLEKVAGGIEAAFEANGVRIGAIEATSFALAPTAAAGSGQVLLLSADSIAFHLLVLRDGRPVLYRSRRFVDDTGEERAGLVRREIDLTNAFLAGNGGEAPSSAIVWEDPASGDLDLVLAAGELFPGGATRLAPHASLEIEPRFPGPLRSRALVAAGAVLGREAS